MDQKYKSDLKSAKLRSALFFAFVMTAFFSILAVIFMLFNISFYILIPVAVFALSVLGLFLVDKKGNRDNKDNAKCYSFELPREYTYEILFEKLSTNRGLDKSYTEAEDASMFLLRGNPEYRVSVVNVEEYNKEQYEKTLNELATEYNKKYSMRRFVAPEKAAKMMYIDFAVTKSADESLLDDISESALDNISDSPQRLSIALAGNTMYIPRVCGNLGYKELLRYEKTVDFLIEFLRK